MIRLHDMIRDLTTGDFSVGIDRTEGAGVLVVRPGVVSCRVVDGGASVPL